MIKESKILGLSIIKQNNGEKLGNVKKIIYSKNKIRVLAILIDEGGIFKESKVIRFKNIKSIGQNAIMVEDKNVIEITSTIPEIFEALNNKAEVISTEIISDNGEVLGYIKDIIIHEESGKVIGFVITEGLVEDLRRGRSILPIMEGIRYGEDKIIINSKIKEQFDKCKDDYKKLLELQM